MKNLTQKLATGLLTLTSVLAPSQIKAHHPHYYVNSPTTAIAGLHPTTITHKNIDRFGGVWNRVDYYHPIPRFMPPKIIPRNIIIQSQGITMQTPIYVPYPVYVPAQPPCNCAPY